MLYYDNTNISDPTKNNKSKACMICHYWFFNHGFKFLIMDSRFCMQWLP